MISVRQVLVALLFVLLLVAGSSSFADIYGNSTSTWGNAANTQPSPAPSADPSGWPTADPSGWPYPDPSSTWGLPDPNNPGGGWGSGDWGSGGWGYPSPNPNSPIGTIDAGVVILDKIVNLGKNVWQVIQAGAPVVNIKTDIASALPQGVTDWEQLGGWQKPVSKLYKIQVQDEKGLPVEFTFRLMYIYGGNVEGKGHYLTHITIVPADLNAKWGQKFNVRVSIPSVTNTGTQADPIAAAVVQVEWSLANTFKQRSGSADFYVRGDGLLQDMTSDDTPETVYPTGRPAAKPKTRN